MFGYDLFSKTIRDVVLSCKNLITMTELQELFREMERRQYNVTRIQWILGISSGILIYLSSRQITSWISSKSAEVAHQSMDNPKFKKKVTVLTEDISKDVLKKLLQNEELKNEVENYLRMRLITAINNPEIQSNLQRFSKRLTDKILNDQEIQQRIGTTLKNSLYYTLIPSSFTTDIAQHSTTIIDEQSDTDNIMPQNNDIIIEDENQHKYIYHPDE